MKDNRKEIIPIGICDDLLDGGIKRGCVYVIGSRPGMGKSMVSTGIAWTLADEGYRVTYISAEGAGASLSSLGKFAIESPHGDNLTIIAYKGSQYPDVEPLLAGILTSGPVDAVIIDYLQLIGSASGLQVSASIWWGRVMRALRAVAKLRDIAIIVTSQIAREVDERPTHKPKIGDLRLGGFMPDATLFLYRPGYYIEDYTGNEMIVIVYADGHKSGEASLNIDLDLYMEPYLKTLEEGKA